MTFVTDTNANLDTDDKLIRNVAQSLVASFKLEGISISLEKALEIVQKEHATLGK